MKCLIAVLITSPSKGSISSCLQIISFSPPFFFPLSSSHSDILLSLLTQFFPSGFNSKTKPFLIFHHDEQFLNLVNIVRSYQKSDTDVCISPLPDRICHHTETWDRRMWHLCLLSLASTSHDTKDVLNFSHTYFLQNLNVV